MALVLAVDDAVDVLSLLEMQLSDFGYDVATAENGREGLEVVRTRRPDVVLLDVAMPIMDGIEMLRRLRADPQTAALPVIALSGKLDPAITERLGALGVRALIHKPHTVAELQARLREALQR
jgi:CheY-like chemotaxis protein